MPSSSAAKQIPYNTSQSWEHVDQPQEWAKRCVKKQAVIAKLVISVLQRNLGNNANKQAVSGEHYQVICKVELIRCKPE
jgi:CO dehydrogenase/acetyl-CoA synthase delta subunit